MPVFLDAAYQLLKDADRPMSPEEITRQALDRSLIITSGLTPERTMSAMLYMDIKKKGTASRFTKIGPNLFALNEKWEPQLKPEPKRSFQDGGVKRKVRLNKATLAYELLDREILSIQTFLSGKNEQLPTSEKICDWVNLCYSLGIYPEGAELFNYVDSTEVNEWYYERTKKMGRLCNLHKYNQ